MLNDFESCTDVVKQGILEEKYPLWATLKQKLTLLMVSTITIWQNKKLKKNFF